MLHSVIDKLLLKMKIACPAPVADSEMIIQWQMK
jgi:hypothetical protein